MAIPDLSSMLILVSIIFISTTPLSTCQKVTDAEMERLCSNTSESGFCYKLLKSDHRTASVNTKGLAEITVDLALFEGRKIQTHLGSLSKTTQDPKSKIVYETCFEHYSGAMSDLKGVLTSLKSDVYRDVLVKVMDAIKVVGHCERANDDMVSNDSSHIWLKNQEFQMMLDIVRAASENLRDLCSETKKSKQCWKFLEPEVSRFPDADSKSVAGVVLDLAIDKSSEIKEKLNQLYQDSSDDQLREKYYSCASNYNDVSSNLGIAKEYLDSDNFRSISAQIDDVKEELKSCRREFSKDSEDPAHIRNRNKEFGVYVEIVAAATDRFLKEKDGDGGDKKQH